jgi:2-keto-4-pentenoate hydratase/2-oxohepta-3-ene-1,7-dioic acid hydratase in catechol pathway
MVETSPSTSAVRLPSTNLELIEGYGEYEGRLSEIANAIQGSGIGEGKEPDEVRFVPPILYPWNLVAVAVNYGAHGEEIDRQIDEDYMKDSPFVFTKSPKACLIATGETLVIPEGREMIDWELELAAIIGKRATRISRDDAADYIWGYGLILDMSDRQMLTRSNAFFNVDWFNAKSRDGFAPMGPYIVSAGFLPNHADLHMELRVNDQVMQDYSTKYMAHNVEELVEFITSIHTLEPGDIIATGTPPGVGKGRKPPIFLKPGDVITAQIEDVCSTTTPIG